MAFYFDVQIETDDGWLQLHDPPDRAIEDPAGLFDMASVRSIQRPRPEGHGTINETRFLGAATIPIPAWVGGATAEEVETSLAEIRLAFLGAVAQPRLIRWRRGSDGLQLQRSIRVAEGSLKTTRTGTPLVWRYLVQLTADDPFSYSQDTIEEEGSVLATAAGDKGYPFAYPYGFNASSGGEATIDNTGDVPVAPVLTIYGGCASPTVRLQETGEEIVIAGITIPASEFLVIDVAARTVLLNGVLNRVQYIDYAATSWFEIPPGEHTVQLLSPSFDANAHVDVELRPAHI